MTNKLYGERKPWNLDTFQDHMHAMTSENLQSKADIAMELAYRDQVIAKKQKALDDLAEFFKSGNSVPVDQARIRTEHFHEIYENSDLTE